MKFTRQTDVDPSTYWTGSHVLPVEINVISHDLVTAEWELLIMLGRLHGYMTPYDIMTGADQGTEKDKDITSIMTAFHAFIYPRMPVSRYTSSDVRIKPSDSKHVKLKSTSIS